MNIAETLADGNPRSRGRTEEVVQHGLDHSDRLEELFACVTLEVFAAFARADPALRGYLAEQLRRHQRSGRKSVAKRAAKLLADPTIKP